MIKIIKINIFKELVKIDSIIYDELPVIFKFNNKNVDVNQLKNSDLIHVINKR